MVKVEKCDMCGNKFKIFESWCTIGNDNICRKCKDLMVALPEFKDVPDEQILSIYEAGWKCSMCGGVRSYKDKAFTRYGTNRNYVVKEKQKYSYCIKCTDLLKLLEFRDVPDEQLDIFYTFYIDNPEKINQIKEEKRQQMQQMEEEKRQQMQQMEEERCQKVEEKKRLFDAILVTNLNYIPDHKLKNIGIVSDI